MSAVVEPEWVEQHLQDASVRILESSIDRATYDTAHIPGALWIDSHGDLLINGDESDGRVITPPQFSVLMSRLGIRPNTAVVWYGDRHNSYAIRGFWMMDHYAHPGGSFVLAGGRERWEREGRPMTDEVPLVEPSAYPDPPIVNEENLATWQQVLDARNRGAVVLDVRSKEEYDGTSVRAARGGHIPGAVHVEWTDATAGPNILKTESELRAMYERAGVTPEKEVITHCQLGIRAAHSWFVLKHVLGFPRVRNYDASWSEWGNRGDLPIES